jgi:hypothetical protein
MYLKEDHIVLKNLSIIIYEVRVTYSFSRNLWYENDIEYSASEIFPTFQ